MQFWIQKNCAFRYFDLKFVHTHTHASMSTHIHAHTQHKHTHTLSHIYTHCVGTLSLFFLREGSQLSCSSCALPLAVCVCGSVCEFEYVKMAYVTETLLCN